jgi:hypothetical protein
MTTPKHVSETVPSDGPVQFDANADFIGSMAARSIDCPVLGRYGLSAG